MATHLRTRADITADHLSGLEGTIREIRRIYGLDEDVRDPSVFYRCYRHCHGEETAKRIFRVPYEGYAKFLVLRDPVDYELPLEITGALAGDYRHMAQPW